MIVSSSPAAAFSPSRRQGFLVFLCYLLACCISWHTAFAQPGNPADPAQLQQSQVQQQSPAAVPRPETEPSEADPQPDDADDDFPRGEPAPARSFRPSAGNALVRQTASVQRQLGGIRRGSDGFFVSSWFSANPVNPRVAIARSFTPPADCDPLDLTIAEAYMRDSATREGVALDLVREVVRRESGFYPCAVSPKGAMGMMQLMPETAESLGVTDPFDPRENIDGGVRLLRRLLDKYKGRPDLALAAYNAGEGAVDKANGVPDYAETREYVGAIIERVFETPPARRPASGNRIAPPRIPVPNAPSAAGMTPVAGPALSRPTPAPAASDSGQAAVQ